MTDPKITDILRRITGSIRPMTIHTTGELNEAGNHIVKLIIPGEGFVIMEMDREYAFGLATALVDPFFDFGADEGPNHG